MRAVLVLSFLAAFVLSFILTAIIRKVAARIGFVDRPGGYKRHERPMPFGGGVAVCLVTCAIVLGAALLAHLSKQHPSSFPVPEAIAEDIEIHDTRQGRVSVFQPDHTRRWKLSCDTTMAASPPRASRRQRSRQAR